MSRNNVVQFVLPLTRLSPEDALEAAKGQFDQCFVIGYGHDGMLHFFSSRNFKPNEVLFCLEQFKARLIAGDYDP